MPSPVTIAAKTFDPLEIFRDNFPLAGTIALDTCPVCDCAEIGRLWQLPQTRLGAPTYLNSPGARFHDLYLDYLPLLKVPQQIFVFDICRRCHSIFRNPKDDDHSSYLKDVSKIAAFKEHGTAPFDGITKLCEKRFPRDTKVVVDAACGSGQVLALLRERHPGLKLLGLELSRPSVDYIRSLGIEAMAVDLDLDDLDPVLAPAASTSSSSTRPSSTSASRLRSSGNWCGRCGAAAACISPHSTTGPTANCKCGSASRFTSTAMGSIGSSRNSTPMFITGRRTSNFA